MSEPVHYAFDGQVATVTLDDGKRNALNPEMLASLNRAIDRAERDDAILVLTGREGVFSAGFDLKVMGQGGTRTIGMLRAGFAMTARLLAYPRPVLAASTGHAMAMGLFLVQSADLRLGIAGPYTYAANEVAIGLPLPRVAAEVLRMRTRGSHFQRVAVLAESFDPDGALEAGLLDRVVDADALGTATAEAVERLAALDPRAHRLTKQRLRKDSIRTIQRSIKRDLADAVALGVRRAMGR